MDKKELIQYYSAVGILLSGVLMAFAALFLSEEHILDGSVLAYVAQCFVYAGSVFGVSVYIKSKFNEIKDDIKTKSEEKLEDSEK